MSGINKTKQKKAKFVRNKKLIITPKKFENKSTSTRGVIDHFIFHVWEGSHHFKTIQGNIPDHIVKLSDELELTVKKNNYTCRYKLASFYLIFSLFILFCTCTFASIERNWNLLFGSLLVFFFTNLFFKNSRRNEVLKLENKLKGKIKNMSQSGYLGKFHVDWRIDFRKRRAINGEIGGLVEEMRIEFQFLKREIKREESLLVPSASKLLNLDGEKDNSDEESKEVLLSNIKEEIEENEIDALSSTSKDKGKIISFSFDNLSVADEVAQKENSENELVSVRINGQDLVCFSRRYRIRGPHHHDLGTYATNSEGGDFN